MSTHSLIFWSLLAQGHKLQGLNDCHGQKKRSWMCATALGRRTTEGDHSEDNYRSKLDERAYQVNKMLVFQKNPTGQVASLGRDTDA